MTLDDKRNNLRQLIEGYERLAVAYSGGVDSTFLAAYAQEVIPGHVLLLNGISPSFPSDEAEFVRQFASSQELPLVTVNTSELEVEDYASNPTSRCYFCKTELYGKLWPVAEEHGYSIIADGANADDLADFRPGHKAAHEKQIVHPLQEAGLTKDEIRQLSREMDLPTWDKPAFACLASRFPYGERITERKLKRVEDAERVLRDADFRIYRVRSHGNLARLEVGEDELERAFTMREDLTRKLKRVGFAFVTLDLVGFRSGSMNALLDFQDEDT